MHCSPISRRRFLANTTLAATAAALHPRGLFAQAVATELPAPVVQGRAMGKDAKITTLPLRGNVSVLMGSGGNIAVLTGKSGKVIVDSGYMTSQPQISAALTALSADPVTHLINTHWHFDHTDGNEWMHVVGAKILAHENTLKRLSTPQNIVAFHAIFPPAPAAALPTETFTDTKTLFLDDVSLRLSHYLPAHTDSDISIYFAQPDVLHTGDTWFNGVYPFIDYSTGGSIDGMIHAANRNLQITTRDTMIIPGHGPVGNKAQLAGYRDVLVYSRDAVATLKKQGKSLDEVVAAKPLAKYDDKWGAGFVKPEMFVGLVYQGV